MKTPDVGIYERGDRGFRGYGKPLEDTKGGTIKVYESSEMGGPFVWICVQDSTWRTGASEAFAHLDAEMVTGLIARLQTWLDDHKETHEP